MDFKKFLPYDNFRPKQLELIDKVYNAIKSKKSIIVDAPNGFGKTLAILISTLPYITEENGILYYLTRTNRQVKRVEDEILLISSKFNIPAISIKNKKDSCINDEIIRSRYYDHKSFNFMCNYLIRNNLCEYFTNFYKLKQKFLDFTITFPIVQSTIRDMGINLNCCPFEIQRTLINKAKVIVSTYNYFLLPDLLPDINILNLSLNHKILVVDEAHNLIEFANNFLNSSLNVDKLYEVDKIIENGNIKLIFETLFNFIESKISNNELRFSVLELISAIEKVSKIYVLQKYINREVTKLYISNRIKEAYLLSEFYDFIIKLSYFNENSKVILEKNEDSLKIHALTFDYSNYFEMIFKPFTSKIFVSATIKPYDYFTKMLGIKDAEIIETNPFNESKIFSIFEISTTTRFIERSNETFNRYAEMICEAVDASKKNIIVFFPSYKVLESVLNTDSLSKLKKEFFIESREMNEAEEEKIIENFENGKNKVLFGVQGGKFSEGEDFKPNIIDLVIIVGLAYDPPSIFLNERINYCDKIFPGKGWLYGYVLAAVRKAIQSIGRAFRGPSDKGIVVFLDSRFSESYVMDHLPWWYKEKKVAIAWSFGKLRRMINKHYFT